MSLRDFAASQEPAAAERLARALDGRGAFRADARADFARDSRSTGFAGGKSALTPLCELS